MIKLTNQIIVVEVPNDATDVKLEMGYGESIVLTWKSESSGYDLTIINRYWVSMVGVTPLLEEQWKEVVGSHTSFENVYCNMTPYQIPVSPKDRWNDLQRHKGLDINKRYAIIKIEK